MNGLARQRDDNAAAERWPSRDMVMGCMPCRPLQNRMPSGHDSFALFCIALSSPNSGRRIRISQRVPSISHLQPLPFRTPIKTPSQKAHRDRRLAKLTKLGYGLTLLHWLLSARRRRLWPGSQIATKPQHPIRHSRSFHQLVSHNPLPFPLLRPFAILPHRTPRLWSQTSPPYFLQSLHASGLWCSLSAHPGVACSLALASIVQDRPRIATFLASNNEQVLLLYIPRQ